MLETSGQRNIKVDICWNFWRRIRTLPSEICDIFSLQTLKSIFSPLLEVFRALRSILSKVAVTFRNRVYQLLNKYTKKISLRVFSGFKFFSNLEQIKARMQHYIFYQLDECSRSKSSRSGGDDPCPNILMSDKKSSTVKNYLK